MEQLVHSAWSMIPFGLMLLTIAVAPLLAEHWWESNTHKLTIALFLGVPTAVCLMVGGMLHDLEHQLFGVYIPFIVLLLALAKNNVLIQLCFLLLLLLNLKMLLQFQNQ